jgi:RpiB/LacA/LacB family sugar-phosphate isomerase
MHVALGCDHGGFELKGILAARLEEDGHKVVDCGACSYDPDDDYPDYTWKVCETLLEGKADRGILVCGSGVGAAIAANKVQGIRASLCTDTFSARQGVEDDDMNVLCLGGRVIGEAMAGELVKAFLGAHFSDAERHRRRVGKIIQMENYQKRKSHEDQSIDQA